jgi:hypothetical protein
VDGINKLLNKLPSPNLPTGAGVDDEDEEVAEACDPLADDGPPGVPPSITAPAPATNNPAVPETDPVVLAADAGAPTPPTPAIPLLVPPPPPPPPTTPLAPLPLVLSGTLPDLEARRLLWGNEWRKGKERKQNYNSSSVFDLFQLNVNNQRERRA